MNNKKDKIITIDCGVSGAYAIKKPYDSTIKTYKLKNDFFDLCDQFIDHSDAIAFVESQHLRKFDFLSGRWHNIHKLCLHYQRIKDSLNCCGVDVIELSPAKWQKYFKLKSKKYKDRKNELKEHAVRIFPDQKVTLWNCDALLMMDYILKQKTIKK